MGAGGVKTLVGKLHPPLDSVLFYLFLNIQRVYICAACKFTLLDILLHSKFQIPRINPSWVGFMMMEPKGKDKENSTQSGDAI